jgi:syntaxin 18
MEEAQLMVENKGLFDKFLHTNSEIQVVERQLAEIQRLQDVFTEKVLEQEKGIDVIHTQTIYTLDNLESANQYIRAAIKNGASRRVIALFCLIVLTLTLLFLDWYNP